MRMMRMVVTKYLRYVYILWCVLRSAIVIMHVRTASTSEKGRKRCFLVGGFKQLTLVPRAWGTKICLSISLIFETFSTFILKLLTQ